MNSCLQCLHCKNPKDFLICKIDCWVYHDLHKKKVVLTRTEQKSRIFMERKLFEQSERCQFYDEMDWPEP